MQQIDWLVKNPGAIDILSAYLALPSVGQGYDPENPNAPAPPAVDDHDIRPTTILVGRGAPPQFSARHIKSFNA